jgi:hypothetical protein
MGPRARLQAESLELRCLLAAGPIPGFSFLGASHPGDTLNSATVLGDLSATPSVQIDAAIGAAPAGAAEVDWYAFTLDRPATVAFAAVAAGVQPPVLSLYVKDPFDANDPATVFGFRQLAQGAGTDPTAGTQFTRALAAGTYYVAASGGGNTLFSPLVASSGYDGVPGVYQLQITATDLDLDPAAGASVLATEPVAGSVLDRSPTVFRLDVSAPIDPTTVIPDDSAWLTYNPVGTFGDGNDQDVPLGAVNFSEATTELQIAPSAPLAPGYYRLQLKGDANSNVDVVAGPDGTPLGTDAQHPSGQDFTLTFQVNGVEGNTAPGAAADDTPAGAHDLGDVSDGQRVQAAGTIGDDPNDPLPFNPSDVDLYHFHISGPGRYAFAAEVFAQRIDSPLNAAASLFVEAPDGHLSLVTANDDTQNATLASDQRSLPLFADPALFAGLTAGDYYVAVSSHRNVPDPNQGLAAGTSGVFDPEKSHSGSTGRTTGDYVLSLRATPENQPPQVVATTPGPGASVDAPPAYLTVQFDAPVDLQQLAFQAYQRAHQGVLASVFVRGADGTVYSPRLRSYDPASGTATFLMLDRLPVGAYQLHLSGALGLTDFAGNPLAGNDPGGDYVTPFTVTGTGVAAPTGAALPQDLGVLFPHELQGTGFSIAPGGTTNSAGAPAGAYRFQVLQTQNYLFLPAGTSWPSGTGLALTDGAGVPLAATTQADGVSLKAFLQPGTYVLHVSESGAAGDVPALRVTLVGSAESPQPLTLGPAPVLRLTLVPARPVVPSPPPRVDAPPPQPPAAAPGSTPSTPAPPAPAPADNAPAPASSASSSGATAVTAAESQPTRSAAPGIVPGATASAGAPLDAPTSQVAALAAGPIGGTGAGMGGDRIQTPRLSLGVPDVAAATETPRGTAAGDVRPMGATATTAEAVARAPLAAPDRGTLRAAAAEVVRLFGSRPWLEMLLDELMLPAQENDRAPARSEDVTPPDDDEAVGAQSGQAACLVMLAAAARELADGRRKPTRGRSRRAGGEER